MAADPRRRMNATFVPNGFDDDYYQPPPAPELRAPEPQRINPELPNQIQDGLQHMSLNALGGVAAPTHNYSDLLTSTQTPHLSPFPRLQQLPPNVPPSDEDLEATLENARPLVLNSNDPEMQLAWAADALVYVGVCVDYEERTAAYKPTAARPGTPQIEHQLKNDAMNITTFLADQHHPKAEFLRGMWLEWGRFEQREDKKEAFRCYSRAADRGYTRAEYRIGMLYESYNDPVKALRHYHRGADVGDAACCYRLGMMTLRGQHGQPKDFAKGVDLIKRSAQAADENAAQGAYVYGMLLARELPQVEVPDNLLPFDERQARINIEKAAYLKFAKAQLKMGSAYELGSFGCEFSPALSVHYNALASKQGEAEADMALSKWFLVGSEGLFPKNEELAYIHAERAAQSGLATAEFALGYFSEIGMYIPVDLDRAIEWYQKAAKHGNEDASGRIEGLSRKQVLSKKDHENVAITRIKSQYGSQRGKRPERLQQRQQQAPSRLGQNMSMGDVRAGPGDGNGGTSSRPSSANAMRLSGGQQPPRPSSTAPYPLEDRLPNAAPADIRPTSMTPYPLENNQPGQRPQPRLGPTGGFFNTQQQPARPATALNPDLRSSSAFQLSPEIRPHSTMTLPSLPPSTDRPASQPYPPSNAALAQRPMTAQPHQLDPRTRLGAGQRIASGPAGLQGFSNAHPNAANPSNPSASSRPSMPPHLTSAPAVSTQGPQSSQHRLDIGFSAPPDERRSRTYGGGQPRLSNTGGNAGGGGGSKPASPILPPSSGSMSHLSQSMSGPGAPPPSQPGGRASAPAGRGGPRPPSSAMDGPAGGERVKPNTQNNGGATSERPKPTAHGSAASVPPSKAGPKTFDEMGVPVQKQDSECAIM